VVTGFDSDNADCRLNTPVSVSCRGGRVELEAVESEMQNARSLGEGGAVLGMQNAPITLENALFPDLR